MGRKGAAWSSVLSELTLIYGHNCHERSRHNPGASAHVTKHKESMTFMKRKHTPFYIMASATHTDTYTITKNLLHSLKDAGYTVGIFRPLNPLASTDPFLRRQLLPGLLRQVERKLVAGAHGVFTQPFFDVDHLRSWRRVVPEGVEVWWGATTVTTLAALGYWRRRNLVAFPQGFRMELEAQREFAQRTIDLAHEWGDNAYLMPVRTSPAEYLQGLRVPEPARA